MDFRKLLDPYWGFTLKTVLGIHDPRISWLPFGTKNHEMRGPPVPYFFKRKSSGNGTLIVLIKKSRVEKLSPFNFENWYKYSELRFFISNFFIDKILMQMNWVQKNT